MGENRGNKDNSNNSLGTLAPFLLIKSLKNLTFSFGKQTIRYNPEDFIKHLVVKSQNFKSWKHIQLQQKRGFSSFSSLSSKVKNDCHY